MGLPVFYGRDSIKFPKGLGEIRLEENPVELAISETDISVSQRSWHDAARRPLFQILYGREPGVFAKE